MMKSKIRILSWLLLFAMITFNCCKEDEPALNDDIVKNFADTMRATSEPTQAMATDGPIIIDTSINQSGNEICTTKTVSWNARFGELVTLGGLDLYPGQVLKAESIAKGAYTTFPYGIRPPICAASELPFTNPKLSYGAARSSYLTTLNDYLNQEETRSIPIVADYSFEKVYAQDQLAVAIGAHLKVGKWANLSSSFDFNNKQTKTRIIIKLIQPFYSVVVDEQPIESFYTIPPTLAEMQSSGVDEFGLVYVSKIVYGRQLFFSMESSASEEDVIAAVNAEFGFWKIKGDFEYDKKHNEIFNSATIRVLVMGGDPTLGAHVITNGLDSIYEYINKGAAFDAATNPGVPLSYQLKKVKDNSVFNVIIASEYKVHECETLSSNNEIITISPSSIGPDDLCPLHIEGDGDFKGNGPQTTVNAELEIRNERELWVKIDFHLKETRSDWTEARGSWDFKLWAASEDAKITRVKSFASSYVNYLDSSITWDLFYPNDLVSRFEINGDTRGKDVGNCNDNDRSALKIFFNPIELEIEKI